MLFADAAVLGWSCFIVFCLFSWVLVKAMKAIATSETFWGIMLGGRR